jgi:hypothetical protein
MCNTPVEVQFTSAGCLNYPCRTPTKFKGALKEVEWKKTKTGLTVPVVIGKTLFGDVKSAVDAVADVGEKLLDGREAVQKWWHPLQEKEFALAGVICEAQRR